MRVSFSTTLSKNLGLPASHVIDGILRKPIGERDMDPECLGTLLRHPRGIGKVALYVDPVSLLLQGIIENQEDRHQLIGPELMSPRVDIEPKGVSTFQIA